MKTEIAEAKNLLPIPELMDLKINSTISALAVELNQGYHGGVLRKKFGHLSPHLNDLIECTSIHHREDKPQSRRNIKATIIGNDHIHGLGRGAKLEFYRPNNLRVISVLSDRGLGNGIDQFVALNQDSLTIATKGDSRPDHVAMFQYRFRDKPEVTFIRLIPLKPALPLPGDFFSPKYAQIAYHGALKYSDQDVFFDIHNVTLTVGDKRKKPEIEFLPDTKGLIDQIEQARARTISAGETLHCNWARSLPDNMEDGQISFEHRRDIAMVKYVYTTDGSGAWTVADTYNVDDGPMVNETRVGKALGLQTIIDVKTYPFAHPLLADDEILDRKGGLLVTHSSGDILNIYSPSPSEIVTVKNHEQFKAVGQLHFPIEHLFSVSDLLQPGEPDAPLLKLGTTVEFRDFVVNPKGIPPLFHLSEETNVARK